MTWFPAFPKSQRLLRVVTAAVAAASVPTLVYAQASEKRAKGEEAPATIRAERMSGRPDRELNLEQDVEITRGDVTINADRATYNVVEDRVEASGNISMQRLGDRYTGDELNFKMDAEEGYVTHPTYRLGTNKAHGQADRIDFEGEDRAKVSDGTYSTCEGPDPDWYLKSDTMNLDKARDIGTAAKTIVYFKGVPILGTPAMSFPLSDARKSGVLPPTIGSTSRGGMEVSVPYYFNIAPNRDLTLYPNVITRRGLQLGADARYLSESYTGQTRLEFLPNDRLTNTNRYAIASTHSQNLAPGLSGGWNINAASDNNYPNDFSRTLTNSGQRLLPRDMNLNYSGAYWNAAARASNFQVLQDPAAPIVRPYDRLPQLTFNAGRLDVQGFDWNFESDFTRFWHPDMVRGDRLVLNPKLSYPIVRNGYFVTPKLSFDLTKYSLQNTTLDMPSSLTRALPTFSLDSGLVFERDARFFGQNMTQTLEPRMFYVKTPFRDQSQYPLFDTAVADLSFAQLFSENRFVGHDRISDANQVTTALISRFIEPSGAERVRVGFGQRFYFSSPRVNLTSTDDQTRSDLLLLASARLTEAVSTEGNLQYSQNLRTLNRGNFGVRWQPAPKRVLNVQYRRDLPNNLEQIDTSGQWPIASRWYAVGRVNYSLPEKKVVEGLFGLEYKADCWIFRVVAQRIPTATAVSTSALFFQLELSGLTRLGSNPLDALRKSVPGYQLIN